MEGEGSSGDLGRPEVKANGDIGRPGAVPEMRVGGLLGEYGNSGGHEWEGGSGHVRVVWWT